MVGAARAWDELLAKTAATLVVAMSTDRYREAAGGVAEWTRRHRPDAFEVIRADLGVLRGVALIGRHTESVDVLDGAISEWLDRLAGMCTTDAARDALGVLLDNDLVWPGEAGRSPLVADDASGCHQLPWQYQARVHLVSAALAHRGLAGTGDAASRPAHEAHALRCLLLVAYVMIHAGDEECAAGAASDALMAHDEVTGGARPGLTGTGGASPAPPDAGLPGLARRVAGSHGAGGG